MPVAYISRLKNCEFSEVRDALEFCIDSLARGTETSFGVTLSDAEIPVLNFYVQAEDFNGDKTISIEAERDIATEAIVWQAKDAKAKFIGWKLPSEGDSNPNYRQSWKLNGTDYRNIADELIDAMKYLGSMKSDSWIQVSPETLSQELQTSGLFWSKTGSPSVLCQRGSNIKQTTQGQAAIQAS